MARIVYLSDNSDRSFFEGSACAFGVFDGVHMGHRFLIGQAREATRSRRSNSVVLTFSIDPDELFAADRLMKLMTNEERIAALSATGADVVAVLPFDRRFAALEPEVFLEWTFGKYPPGSIHVGEGFRFGCKGSGTVKTLERWGVGRGMGVRCHDLLEAGGLPVSSTRIRGLIAQGALEEAESLLEGHVRRLERQ